MNIKIKFLFLIGCLSLVKISMAQPIPPNPSLISLKNYVTRIKPNCFDSSYNDLHYLIGENLNYLYPIYQLLGNDKKFHTEFYSPGLL